MYPTPFVYTIDLVRLKRSMTIPFFSGDPCGEELGGDSVIWTCVYLDKTLDLAVWLPLVAVGCGA